MTNNQATEDQVRSDLGQDTAAARSGKLGPVGAARAPIQGSASVGVRTGQGQGQPGPALAMSGSTSSVRVRTVAKVTDRQL